MKTTLWLNIKILRLNMRYYSKGWVGYGQGDNVENTWVKWVIICFFKRLFIAFGIGIFR